MELVVFKIRHSLQMPAMRLRHSLQDPMTRSAATATVGGLHKPSLHLRSPARKVNEEVLAKATTASALRGTVRASLGPIGTAHRIVQREGFFALYKGLTAVYTGIVPKMAIRFLSFEQYQEALAKLEHNGKKTSRLTFVAGLASGLTEAILVVTPAEVCKI